MLAGLQDRVVESSQWFAQGYFGVQWAALNSTAFSVIAEDKVTPSWITPMNTCKNWQYAYGNNVRAVRTDTALHALSLTSLLDALRMASATIGYDRMGKVLLAPDCEALEQVASGREPDDRQRTRRAVRVCVRSGRARGVAVVWCV